MADLNSTRTHPTTELLEEYAFNRLSEAETSTVEEHLLVCGACQTLLADVEEYILLMKHAASWPKSPVHCTTLETDQGFTAGKSRRARFALGVAALAACVTLVIAMQTLPADASPEQVHLVALRGATTDPNKIRPGRGLELTIDLRGLRTEESYHAEIVDAGGSLEWTGKVPGSGDVRTFLVAKKFSSGQHWVRLYANDTLRREFGLKIE